MRLPYCQLFIQPIMWRLPSGAQVKGRYLGMPAWTNSKILFYRRDLFEDAKEQAAFEKKYGYPLAPPTSWGQFSDAACVLHP
ncbi:hypothetical protein ACTMTU_04520 [Streptomyces sp. OZ13]|uniref:hypothetical protein n=1 Tax=Streptomyces sp. OZ13 TaxID=3452210 RepID=UPI003F89A8C8